MTKRYEMKAEYLDKWLAQLRSQQAEQTRNGHYLENLGESARTYAESRIENGKPVCGCAIGQFAAANPDVSFFPGGDINLGHGSVMDQDLQTEMIRLNDYTHATFEDIAAWLEASVERV